MTGYPFILDGRASESYGLSIVSINDTSWSKPSGGEIEFITDQVGQNSELLLMGAQYSSPLSFNLEIICEDETVDAHQFFAIKQWLTMATQFRKLQICAPNLDTFHFNCQIRLEEDYLLEGYRGVQCSVLCDSSFAWRNEKTKALLHSGTGTSTIRHSNLSADPFGQYPAIEFTAGSEGSLKIVNRSCDDLTFEWTGLQNGEKITCDGKTGMISSSTGLNRIGNFNKTFLMLRPGLNVLEITGDATGILMRYKDAVQMGGAFY